MIGDAGAVGASYKYDCQCKRTKRETNLIAHVGDAGAVGGREKLHRPHRLREGILDRIHRRCPYGAAGARNKQEY